MSAASRWLVILVVLLAGVGIGQYLHIRSSQSSLAQLREELRAELAAERAAGSAAGGRVEGAELAVARADSADELAATQPPRPEPEVPPPPPAAPARTVLSGTAYWIDADATEDRPFGLSALVVLGRGGEILVERCDAPDYTSLEVDAEEQPYAIPTCQMLIEGRVLELSDDRLAFADREGRAQGVGFELTGSGDDTRLVLEIGGSRYTLAPGQKNTLWEKLTALPSVQRERDARWAEHVRLREAGPGVESAGLGSPGR